MHVVVQRNIIKRFISNDCIAMVCRKDILMRDRCNFKNEEKYNHYVVSLTTS